MKRIGLLSISMLLALLVSVPAFCRQERQEDAKPAQDQTRPEKTPDVKPDREAKPEQQEKAPKAEEQKQDERAQQENKQEQKEDKKAQEQNKKDQEKQMKSGKQMTPAKDNNRAMAGNQGKKGGHIPDEKFRSQFGRQHTFVVNRPVIVDNQPRIQYAGYSFELVDPWPSAWAYTDECYIDYIDDTYYLIDPLHPGIRVALIVIM